MKMSGIKKFLSGLIAGFVCLSSLPGVATEMGTHAAMTLTTSPQHDSERGWYNDYHHEIWQADTPNSSTMTLNEEDGGFSTEWKCGPGGSRGNFLARRGLFYGLDNPNQWEDYGGFTCEFDCTWSAGSSGNSRICIYGWAQNPLVEYYIIEDWKNWNPGMDTSGNTVEVGSAFIDGSNYKIYKSPRNSYTIEGNNKDFTQYISVREDTRTSGTISISEHFKAWEALGMEMGNFYEVAFNVEGWESDGSATVHCTIAEGATPTPTPTIEPDENGDYTVCTFEEGTDKFSARGTGVSVKNDSDNYYSGSKSLKVSGRTANWNGAEISVPTSAFKAGKTYSFSTAAMQNSGEDTTLKFTLQYTLSGDEKYAEVASATAKSGEWTKLENTEFTIPTGASGMKLYVEAPDSLTDFYIDEVRLSIEGRQSPVVNGGGTVKGAVTTTSTTTTTTTTSTTTTTTTTTAPDVIITTGTVPVNLRYSFGDVNMSGTVDMSDAVAIMRWYADPTDFPLSDEAKYLGDVIGADGLTNRDALVIQQYEAGIVKSLPVDTPATLPVITASNTTVRTNATTQATVQTSAAQPTTTKTQTTTQASSDVIYAANSFENGADGWESRGSATIKNDSDSYYSGSKSLYVSGRSSAWQGAQLSLDGTELKAGNTYSISAAVLQGSSSPVEMKISLQYKDASGQTVYDSVAKATAESGVWTSIGNTEYTIPAGATDLLLYVETTDSLTNFYLDDVQLAGKGKSIAVVTGKGTVNIPEPQSPVGVDISWIDPSKPMVAISFDDGTRNPSTETRIIDALDKSGFHATFFYVGDWITSPDTVRYAYQKGMEIANHTTSHPYLSKISASEIRSEYDTTAAKLKSIIGTEPSKLMRLPFLDYNDTVKQVLNDVPLISCAIDTADWNGASKDAIVNTIKSNMNNGNLNGAIVLCHENYETTASAMEEVLPYLKSQGWQVVTISEMFAVKGKELSGGTVYTRCT